MFYVILAIIVVGLRTTVFLMKRQITQEGPTTKYLCVPCGYIYDEAKGDPDGGLAP